ncbi:MAG: beta-ketoacyl-[acyl-carrier-protein] synthase family protein [Candidatus Omnitrophica bacterium]|nr:beta-ketoacyl-[acyl-carrier-protein] synthase family protein [Candidatus Omnitrophota bacterium]MCF7894021.1 beta-ketoacyl-[acyl-carrier-protein] synthase family protein [Candidatus Omnitrophota bacterium]
MKEKVAITGLGVVSPCGLKKETFWANLKKEESFIEEIKRFDSKNYPSHIAGQVSQLDYYTHLSKRLTKKIDIFSHMALVSSEEAIVDSKMNLDDIDKERVGVFMGNALGGWLFAETELRDMYIEGRDGISPYMASAWFPAAPQGQITIYYGFKGYSKTTVSDKASSALALWYGAKTIKEKKNDYVLAGGMEAPITPYALLSANCRGDLSKNNSRPQEAYKPYDLYRDGLVLAEGSGTVVLESQNQARKRKAPIYGYIEGIGFSSDGYHYARYRPTPENLEYAIKECLKDAGWQKEDVDYICLDAESTEMGDYLETQALKNVFGEKIKNIALSAPKSMYGNLLGAQTALDLITTLFSMQNCIVLPTINYSMQDPYCDLDYTPNKSVEKEIDKALIISRGRGGINIVLAIEKAE